MKTVGLLNNVIKRNVKKHGVTKITIYEKYSRIVFNGEITEWLVPNQNFTKDLERLYGRQYVREEQVLNGTTLVVKI